MDLTAAKIAHDKLVRSLPSAVGTYSYRRVSEPFNFKRRDYNKRPDMEKELQDNAHLLAEGEKAEIRRVFVLESRGKGDNPILTVIKVEWLPMFELLNNDEFRNWIGLDSANMYIFGTQKSQDGLGHANPSACQRHLAELCKDLVADHTLLRSRNFRVTFATNLSALNMTYRSKGLMCDLLGHQLSVHESHYNISQSLQMASMMGFACRASAENKIKDLHTQTIEEQLNISIDTSQDESSETL